MKIVIGFLFVNGHVERSFDLSVFWGGSSVEVFPAAAGVFLFGKNKYLKIL